uniref:Uncharacterized protein n=1 Tax=Oryza sativa subsp. japonica TaxID=39947 RepID=Q6YS14_ORYSJ|nr:hypothetical protein [Oryza sativa Japonica Group]
MAISGLRMGSAKLVAALCVIVIVAEGHQELPSSLKAKGVLDAATSVKLCSPSLWV